MKTITKTITKSAKVLTLGVAIACTGCASRPAPNFANGGYYMAGDDDCKLWRASDKGSINCYTKDDKFTGIRYPMTNQQLEMYRYNQQREAQAWANLNQQIKNSQPVRTSCNTIGTYTNCSSY